MGHHVHRCGALPVPQLADVEVPLLAIEPRRSEPTEKDVARRLCQALALHDALPLVLALARRRVWLEDGVLGLFHLEEQRILIVAKLSPRTFPERVDFVTSPGQRVKRVITDKGVLEPDGESRELVLAGLYPGVEAAAVQAEVGWKLRCRQRLTRLDPPTKVELQLLRDVLDPQHLYLKS